MTIQILSHVLGPIQTNSYLILDRKDKKAIIVDPAKGSKVFIEEADKSGCSIVEIWVTHPHFDHVSGIHEIVKQLPIPIRINPKDESLYLNKGFAGIFGVHLDDLPVPQADLNEGTIQISMNSLVKILHVPGHTPGHVVFYFEEEKAIVCGDVIFYHGIGRTDLPGSSQEVLLNSIRKSLFSLPSDTTLLPGHGPGTSIQEEKTYNPFFK